MGKHGGWFNFHLVNWYSIFTPIQEGGLGAWSLLTFNQAFLGKWS